VHDVLPVPLDRLRANPDFQPRARGLDPEHLERLRASDPATWPPLLVAPDADGGYDVVDGFHRLHVARELSLPTLPCVVDEGAGYADAAVANLAHGLPLSLADRKAFARWLHDQLPDLSYVELGRASGLSDKTAKRALAGPSESSSRAGGFPPRAADPVEQLVRLARAAVRDRTGVNRLAQLVSGKSDERQRAEYVGHVLARYSAAERSDVAAALMVLGRALIAGARRHVPRVDA
jgi:ParB-like chromosome segregation protein Spo0J